MSAFSIVSGACKQLLTLRKRQPSCMQGHCLRQQKPGNFCWPATAMIKPSSLLAQADSAWCKGHTIGRQQRSAAQPLPWVVA